MPAIQAALSVFGCYPATPGFARRAVIIVALLQVAQTSVFAETVHDVRVWINLTGQGPLAHESRWRWYFDVQNRDRNSARDIDQFVARPGVGFALSERSSVWAGYAYTANFTAGGKVYENRVWEQYVWTTPVSSSSLSLRTRVEQRFFNGTSRTGWRIREQIRWTRPVQAKPSINSILWDEVLFHMNTTTRSQRGLDQNRAFAGIGIKLNSKLRIDVGYLNQFIHSFPTDRMNHALSGVVNLSF